MITRNIIDLESFSHMAITCSEALRDAMGILEDVQENHVSLRRAVKRLLECPALNTNGLETEDQQAISGVLAILEATTVGGTTRRPPLEEL